MARYVCSCGVQCDDPATVITRADPCAVGGFHAWRANPDPTREELLAELEALEAERDCLALEIDRLRAELDS